MSGDWRDEAARRWQTEGEFRFDDLKLNDLFRAQRPIDGDTPIELLETAFRSIEVPVERVYIELGINMKRQARRGEASSTRTASRWLMRPLRRCQWRYVLASDTLVRYGEVGDDFIRNRRRVRASVRVLFPPPGILEGVEALETRSDIVSVAWPSRDLKARLLELRRRR